MIKMTVAIHLHIGSRLLMTIVTFMPMIAPCFGQDCESMIQRHTSYDDIVRTIRSTKFQIKDGIATPESSWIKSAEFYSCNGKKGYFIYDTKAGQTYIHKELPIGIWEAFKKADSKGSYYNRNIKGRYQLSLGGQ